MMTLNYKVFSIILLAASAAFICWRVYEAGQHSVQTKWDAQKRLDEQAINKAKGENDALSRQHKYEVELLQARLKTANESYQASLDSITNQYTARLQQSEQRAKVYQRQAKGGATECRSLASHAARLDNSLEQGRQLVEELRATVRLRDGQIIELSNQIRADRKLLE